MIEACTVENVDLGLSTIPIFWIVSGTNYVTPTPKNIVKERMKSKMVSLSRPQIPFRCAGRGVVGSKSAPLNTLRGEREGVDFFAQSIETNVRRTVVGRPVDGRWVHTLLTCSARSGALQSIMKESVSHPATICGPCVHCRALSRRVVSPRVAGTFKPRLRRGCGVAHAIITYVFRTNRTLVNISAYHFRGPGTIPDLKAVISQWSEVMWKPVPVLSFRPNVETGSVLELQTVISHITPATVISHITPAVFSHDNNNDLSLACSNASTGSSPRYQQWTKVSYPIAVTYNTVPAVIKLSYPIAVTYNTVPAVIKMSYPIAVTYNTVPAVIKMSYPIAVTYNTVPAVIKMSYPIAVTYNTVPAVIKMSYPIAVTYMCHQ
ncbi:hypothetical protein J6590_002190 [Homalodisca vitripennis]|nr:hypothetical protein J6590_002190 [Homalodisca vitripennis]